MKSPVILILLLLSIYSGILPYSSIAEEDEDLSFLEERERNDAQLPDAAREYENYDDLEDEEYSGYADGEDDAVPAVDESHVAVLTGSNFSDFIESNKFAMVEFYAPWCGHCRALAPEYAAAAEDLKDEDVVLAKVDAAEEADLSQKYDVQGFPTIYLFVDGVHKLYTGLRTKDSIVSWLKKKIGPGLHNISSIEEAEKIMENEDRIVVGYLESLAGSESEELAAASRLEDEVIFYQTNSPQVAKVFLIDPTLKPPSLVMLKKEAERFNQFVGEFKKSAIAEFVYENKLPLVTNFTRESAPKVFDNPIKKQLILFATSTDLERYYPIFQEAAMAFKGKLVCLYVDLDNDDVGKEVSEYFGVRTDETRVLAYTGNEEARKFIMDGGSEFSAGAIRAFGEKFLEDNLKPFYKSEPLPEKNDGDVKIVVGDNFDEIVLDESRDVLLEIYAPWCGHCQALEPVYNRLGRYLGGIDSVVIAKMDGTANEHPRAKTDGFPTILFFPAGNKSFDPVTVDTDRTVVAFYKFLKKHASIPFKLPTKLKDANSASIKDEL
ncbi:hypothetical protein M569_04842 [Genlisea aurea]|uniref:Protein disulfide-isomerase n=1 Tax=Genlisea aurea TaxID=192259 RepID=S8CY36_9LAMI|nr:hypothetical protein M569_04842 [Genlisea aurea]